MIVLGIETSCDETAAAVVKDGREVLSNVIHSQMIHVKFGGVVPELAGREHVKRIIPIVEEALRRAGVSLEDIDAVAATYGPGLVGALLVGLSYGKALAFAAEKKFFAVNHLEGHIAANPASHPDLPASYLTLLISGGHTMLIDVESFGRYRLLGRTLDDAAGEAFDKVAKILGLGYPGGADVDRLAKVGDPKYVRFPRALPEKDRLDFSYSGLKTAVSLYVAGLTPEELDKHRPDIAASFQEAAVDMLCAKSKLALTRTGRKVMALSGGVAANSRLREKTERMCQQMGVRLVYPPPALCTDNAAMVAAAGTVYLKQGLVSGFDTNAVPYVRLPLIES